MNRIIKFRAWDGQHMHYSLHDNERMDISTGFIVYDTCDGYKVEDKYTLMQFVGIQDNEGKDIYEGDILSCWDGDGETHVEYGGSAKGVVEAFGNHFALNVDGVYLTEWSNAENIRIDSNIYEIKKVTP